MKIGLYFGSFNPIHTGHLIIASHILNETDVQKVWFVVSPQNPLKPSNALLNEYHRLHLVQKAIDPDIRLRAIDIEFTLPKPSYTIHTLTYLQEKYPKYDFSVIMGSDSFQNLHNWKNGDLILKTYQILVYKRPGFDVAAEGYPNVTVLNAPLLDISATHIRELIRAGKSIKYLVPEEVEKEIYDSGFYKKAQTR
jgi:nicotinate-nucleotide adenylyltransferase